MYGGGAANADDKRADQRAFNRAHSTDRNHREGEDNHLDPDAKRYRHLGSHHRPTKRAEHRSDDESHRVDQSDVDPEGCRRLAVENYRCKKPAVAGEFTGSGSAMSSLLPPAVMRSVSVTDFLSFPR